MKERTITKSKTNKKNNNKLLSGEWMCVLNFAKTIENFITRQQQHISINAIINDHSKKVIFSAMKDSCCCCCCCCCCWKQQQQVSRLYSLKVCFSARLTDLCFIISRCFTVSAFNITGFGSDRVYCCLLESFQEKSFSIAFLSSQSEKSSDSSCLPDFVAVIVSVFLLESRELGTKTTQGRRNKNEDKHEDTRTKKQENEQTETRMKSQ